MNIPLDKNQPYIKSGDNLVNSDHIDNNMTIT
jgi:hypothetical protein